MPSIIDHFDALTDRGLKVIPLRENSKIPLAKGWTENWDRDLSRENLLRFPNCNIGLLLGEIVDVEGDSEEANETILSLIGNYPHPTYRSKKSIHHLFLSPDRNLRHFSWKKIEFRGHGHQSVLPPSQHAGIRYCWLKNFQFPVPEMPERLAGFYKSLTHVRTNEIKPGHTKVWCCCCNKQIFLNEKRFQLELEVFNSMSMKWECQACRNIDIRSACRLVRKTKRHKITKN